MYASSFAAISFVCDLNNRYTTAAARILSKTSIAKLFKPNIP